jgi:superfamily II DNA or RNA helicase
MHHFLAYIDPGSGSLIIQAVIAGIVAIPFFFRQQIGRFVRSVRRTDETEATDSSRSSDQAT